MVKFRYSIQITHDNQNATLNTRQLTIIIHPDSIDGSAQISIDGGGFINPVVPLSGIFEIDLSGFNTGLIEIVYKDDLVTRKLCDAKYYKFSDLLVDCLAGQEAAVYPSNTFLITSYEVKEYANLTWELKYITQTIFNENIRTQSIGAITKTLVSGSFITFNSTEVEGEAIADRIGIFSQTYELGCTFDHFEDVFVGDAQSPLAATFIKTNTTSTGAADGTITLIVTGGSGTQSFLWDDLTVTQNRTGLIENLYSVTITDVVTAEEVELNNIPISDPVSEQVIGTILEATQVNSLRFAEVFSLDSCNNQITPDNSFLLEQGDRFIKRDQYFQKVNKCDTLVIQINSNFDVMEANLLNCLDDSVAKSFVLNQVVTNVGKKATFNIRIQNNGAGTSRVYFTASQAIPILLEVGDAFEIVNNADGFDGSYSIQNILNDDLLGSQFLVINKNYGIASPTSLGEGIFDDQSLDFDIYHLIADFSALLDGNYYIQINAIVETIIVKTLKSEPISLSEDHEATIKIQFTNTDNAFNVDYQTGIFHSIRVPSRMVKAAPAASQTSIRSTDSQVTKLSAKPERKYNLEFFNLPAYLHELISLAFNHDTVLINGVEFGSQDGLAEPSYIDNYNLANSSITVEQTEWFETFNGDDLGGIDEGGFIDNEQSGFITLN